MAKSDVRLALHGSAPPALEENFDKLVEAYGKGLSLRLTAGYVGVTYPQLQRWLACGVQEVEFLQLEAEGVVDLPTHYSIGVWRIPRRAIYARFLLAMSQRRSEVVAERIDKMELAAKLDPKAWTALAWLLERTQKDDFGRADRLEVDIMTGQTKSQLEDAVGHDRQEDIAKAVLEAAAMRKRLKIGGSDAAN